MSVDEGVRKQRGGPGTGKAVAALEHRLGWHAREDALNDLLGEILARRRRRHLLYRFQCAGHVKVDAGNIDRLQLTR